jgi:hypothetical protein
MPNKCKTQSSKERAGHKIQASMSSSGLDGVGMVGCISLLPNLIVIQPQQLRKYSPKVLDYLIVLLVLLSFNEI